jgi:putative transposase
MIRANQAGKSDQHAVRVQCRVLGVSPSGYYDWIRREPSQREKSNALLLERIQEIYTDSDDTYGAVKVRAELRDDQDRKFDPRWSAVGRHRVARLMRAAGLRGVSRRRGFTVTTERDRSRSAAPDLVKRQFSASGPNQLWVSDITYVPTWAGFIYLAIVMDVWSRKVVGWAIGEQMLAELVVSALNMALAQRNAKGVIHHSDHGSQYTSVMFGKRCVEMGVVPSMGTVGDAYDNAMAESFFASLECELIDRRVFRSKAEARVALFRYVEGWYNSRRRHGAIGYLSPNDYERRLWRCPPHGAAGPRAPED